MNNTKLSVITINYNNADGLKKTLDSVISQTSIGDYYSFEHIIVDGASTDGSKEIIEKALENTDYAKHVSFWCSEKDGGIYSAMNKGVSHATGEYCLILNSGDILYDNDVIKNAVPLLDGTDVISGILKGDNFLKIPDESFTFFSYMRSFIPHGSTFVKTEVCKAHPYSEDYKIISDCVFFYEILEAGATYKTIPVTIEYFDMTGISTQRPPVQDEELKRFYKKIVPNLAWEDWEMYCRFAFFDKAIKKSRFWMFIYKVCRRLIIRVWKIK